MKKIFFCFILSFSLFSVVAQDFNDINFVDSTALTTDKMRNIDAFSKGLDAVYSEDVEKAVAYLEKALIYDASDDGSMYELCMLYIRQGRIGEAFEMIKKANELKPNNKWYRQSLATFYRQFENYDKFIEIYDGLLSEEPTNINYLEVYIEVLLETEKYDAAIDKLNVLEQELGASEYLSLEKIEIYKAIGDDSKVITETEHLVEINPFNTRYLSMLAELYMKSKREKDAFKLYLKIKEIDPEDKYINISLLDYYRHNGEIDKAHDEFVLALRNKNLDFNTKESIFKFWFEGRDNHDDDVKKQLVEAGEIFVDVYPDAALGYYILGTYHYDNDDFVEAEKMYVETLKRDSTMFNALYFIGFTEIQLENSDKLRFYADRGIKLYPIMPVFYYFRGIADFNEKQYESAVTFFEKGCRYTSEKELITAFNTYIGDCYHSLGNKKKAYEYYDKVLAESPDNVYVLNNYAYFLSLDGEDLERALKMSAQTVEKEPKNTTYIDTYAWVLYKLKRYKEAEKWMKKVFSYDKNPDAVNYEHYGDILFMLGNTKKAVENWKKASKLGGGSDFLERKIKEEKLIE